MKRILILSAALFATGWAGCSFANPISAPRGIAASADSPAGRAFRDRASNVQVTDGGVVARLLADDTDGSRHQRFIVRLASGQTVLIAHNIDLSVRVAGLRAGDKVRFCGEYVWSEKGGTVHWTHHDPNGKHVTGWILHGKKLYQ